MDKKEELERIEAFRAVDEVKKEEISFKKNEKKYQKSKAESAIKQKKRELKLRRFKKIVIAGVIVSSLVGLYELSVKSYNKGYNDGEKEKSETMKEDYLHTYTLYNAPDEILVEWANFAFGKYSEDMLLRENDESNEAIEIFRESYFAPLMRAYYNYVDTGSQDDYNSFRNSLVEYEEELGEKYSFKNSIYSYAVLVDEEDNIVDKSDGNTRIFIAEDFYDITSSTISYKEGSILKDGKIYVPYDTNENQKTYK